MTQIANEMAQSFFSLDEGKVRHKGSDRVAHELGERVWTYYSTNIATMRDGKITLKFDYTTLSTMRRINAVLARYSKKAKIVKGCVFVDGEQCKSLRYTFNA